MTSFFLHKPEGDDRCVGQLAMVAALNVGLAGTSKEGVIEVFDVNDKEKLQRIIEFARQTKLDLRRGPFADSELVQ